MRVKGQAAGCVVVRSGQLKMGSNVRCCYKFTIEIDKRSDIVKKLDYKYNYVLLYEESFK